MVIIDSMDERQNQNG